MTKDSKSAALSQKSRNKDCKSGGLSSGAAQGGNHRKDTGDFHSRSTIIQQSCNTISHLRKEGQGERTPQLPFREENGKLANSDGKGPAPTRQRDQSHQKSEKASEDQGHTPRTC